MNKNIRLEQLSKEQIKRNLRLRNNSTYLPKFHISPPFGLLNDPNGLVKIGEKYHLYFQWYPGGPTHGLKYWYHLETEDFINYVDQGVGIHPDFTWDQNGAYSGSAIKVNQENYVIYTGNYQNQIQHQQRQIIASLTDEGKIINKKKLIADNEYIQNQFRDPVMYKQDGQMYILTGAEKRNANALISVYQLHDDFQVNKMADLSLKYSKQMKMIECPNVIDFGQKKVLLYSPQGFDYKTKYECQNTFSVIYQVGTTFEFSKEQSLMKNESDFIELDKGHDFYAPQVFNADNQQILIAWIGCGKSKYPEQVDMWMNILSIPRILKLEGAELIQIPHPAIDKLIENTYITSKVKTKLMDSKFKLEFNLDLENSLVIGTEQEYIELKWNQEEFKFDRSNQSEEVKSLHGDVRYAKRIEQNQKIIMYIDNSVIEIFINNGKNTISSRFYLKELNEIKFKQELQYQLSYLKAINLEYTKLINEMEHNE